MVIAAGAGPSGPRIALLACGSGVVGRWIVRRHKGVTVRYWALLLIGWICEHCSSRRIGDSWWAMRQGWLAFG
ncbi:hypothetical protein KC315_g52 [Hortaea werneckii]|nr:hypothetical protein KC315_g52 [Hortaea werneckii]